MLVGGTCYEATLRTPPSSGQATSNSLLRHRWLPACHLGASLCKNSQTALRACRDRSTLTERGHLTLYGSAQCGAVAAPGLALHHKPCVASLSKTCVDLPAAIILFIGREVSLQWRSNREARVSCQTCSSSTFLSWRTCCRRSSSSSTASSHESIDAKSAEPETKGLALRLLCTSAHREGDHPWNPPRPLMHHGVA